MIETLVGHPLPHCFSFSSHGHARPEVCSAVTGLASSVAAYLSNLEEATSGLMLDFMIGDGAIRFDVCILIDEPDLINAIRIAFEILTIGLEQIGASARDHYNESVLQSRTVDNDYFYIKQWRSARLMTRDYLHPPDSKPLQSGHRV